jgi:hypothetical protein
MAFLLGMVGNHEVFLQPYRGNVLIAGKSGIGKSTRATAFTEHMAAKRFTFFVFYPEGDYDELRDAISIGSAKIPPSDDEAIRLQRTATSVVINTQCLSVRDRPRLFGGILPQVSLERAKTGRPYWLVINEAHHLPAPGAVPAAWTVCRSKSLQRVASSKCCVCGVIIRQADADTKPGNNVPSNPERTSDVGRSQLHQSARSNRH